MASVFANPIENARRLAPAGASLLRGLFDGGENTAANATWNAIPGAVAGAAAAGRDATARMEVEFPNVPPGTRLNSEVRGDGLDPGVETGMQFAGRRNEPLSAGAPDGREAGRGEEGHARCPKATSVSRG